MPHKSQGAGTKQNWITLLSRGTEALLSGGLGSLLLSHGPLLQSLLQYLFAYFKIS